MVPLSVVPKPFRSFLLRKLRGSAATPGLEGTVSRPADLQSGRNAFAVCAGELLRGRIRHWRNAARLKPALDACDRHPATAASLNAYFGRDDYGLRWPQ
jgi:hypothetical protein